MSRRSLLVPDVATSVLAAAGRQAATLGHIPLRQGASFECPRCGASGTVIRSRGDTEVTGTITREKCGGAP